MYSDKTLHHIVDSEHPKIIGRLLGRTAIAWSWEFVAFTIFVWIALIAFDV